MTMTDDALQPALHRFQDAVSNLVDRRREHIDGRRRYTDSWYRQLCEAVAGGTGPRSGGRAGLPLWPAAFDLLRAIDTEVHAWHLEADTAHRSHPFGTTECLTVYADTSWRPQDTELLTARAATIEAWTTKIGKLLDPPWQAYLPDPCPVCGSTDTPIYDSGEQVHRKPLAVGFDGCLCAACGTFWEAINLPLLGRMLGYPHPEGVIEHVDTTYCGS